MLKKLATLLLTALLGSSSGFAAEIVLTSGSQSLNGAIFEVYGAGSSGTGVINPFLRLHDVGNGDNIERAYNSGYPQNNFPPGFINQPGFDPVGGNFTYNITLGDVGKETIGGTDYRTFLLDLNETNNGSNNQISLSQFKIFLDADSDLVWTSFPDDAFFDRLVYSLDSNGDNTAVLNDLFSGSGKYDVKIRIPDSMFVNAPATAYLYLYAQFEGLTIGNNSYDGPDGGFEEFAALNTFGGPGPVGPPGGGSGGGVGITEEPSTVPEPASLVLWLASACGLGMAWRKRRRSVSNPASDIC